MCVSDVILLRTILDIVPGVGGSEAAVVFVVCGPFLVALPPGPEWQVGKLWSSVAENIPVI